MLEAEGTIIALDGKRAVIQSRARSGCGHCAHQSHCGVGVLSKALPGGRQQITLDIDQPVSLGQSVVLGIPEQGVVKAALWLYLVPLLGLITGALALAAILPGSGDGGPLLGAVAGGMLGWLLSRRILQREATPPVRLLSTKPLATIPVKCEE